MGVRILGWGKWGDQVVKKLPPISWINAILPIREHQYNEADIFIDPLAAESWHNRPPFIDIEETVSQPGQKRIRAAIGSEGFRCHIAHAGDHFATGCLSAFLRTREAGATDALVLLLPQIGVNESTVGRLLAEIYGLRKFADIVVLLDASAPQFALMDEGAFAEQAVRLIKLLLCMERSVCGLQLLEQMAAKTFSFALQPIKTITQACSLEPLWQNCSVEKNFGMAPGNAWLSVSVSNRKETYLPRIILSNLDRRNSIYLPFLKKYEWKEANAYGEPFLGVFCADHIPPGTARWLRAYWRHYFPDKSLNMEQSGQETERWLKTHFINQHWQPLGAETAHNAMEFCKNKYFQKRGVKL